MEQQEQKENESKSKTTLAEVLKKELEGKEEDDLLWFKYLRVALKMESGNFELAVWTILCFLIPKKWQKLERQIQVLT